MMADEPGLGGHPVDAMIDQVLETLNVLSKQVDIAVERLAKDENAQVRRAFDTNDKGVDGG